MSQENMRNLSTPEFFNIKKNQEKRLKLKSKVPFWNLMAERQNLSPPQTSVND